MTDAIQIVYTDDYEKAAVLRDEGYEPIECAFGAYGSVLGPLNMDHHGTESHRPGVAIRAAGPDYGARRDDPRFVVTGTPDADATLAIVALSAAVPQDQIPAEFVATVDQHDRDPIGFDLTQAPHGATLLAFNQTTLPRGKKGFRASVARMVELLTTTLSSEEERRALGTERSRQRRAAGAIEAVYGPGGMSIEPERLGQAARQTRRVALTRGTVWGFDVWYEWAPVVVSFSDRLKKITLGCPDDETATAVFGERGLFEVYEAMGQGWGGRATVGGSPRGVPMTFEAARATAIAIGEMLEGVASPRD